MWVRAGAAPCSASRTRISWCSLALGRFAPTSRNLCRIGLCSARSERTGISNARAQRRRQGKEGSASHSNSEASRACPAGAPPPALSCRAAGSNRDAHPRIERSARAADRDLGGAAGHQQLAGRARAGLRGHAGQRGAHLRSQVRHALPVRRRCLPRHGIPQRATGVHSGSETWADPIRPPTAVSAAPPGPGRSLTSPTARSGNPTVGANHSSSPAPISADIGPSSRCRCSRRTG